MKSKASQPPRRQSRIGCATSVDSPKTLPKPPSYARTSFNETRLLDVHAVAERLGMSPRWVWRLVQQERIPYYRFGAKGSASMASKSKHGRRCIIVMGTVNRVGNDTIGTETVDTNVYSPSKWDRLSQAGPELFYYQCHNCEKVYHHTARMPKHFWFQCPESLARPPPSP